MIKNNKPLVVLMVLLSMLLVGSYVLFMHQEKPLVSASMSGKVAFTTTNIQGVAVDDSLFKDTKLTMVNVWGTFCGPCIDELPSLEKVHQALKAKDIKVIGVVGDIPPDSKDREALIKEANRLVAGAGVTYINILPDKLLEEGALKDLQAYPTTFFVDPKGQIVGGVITGAQSESYYEQAAEKILKNMK